MSETDITLYISEAGDDAYEGTQERPLWSVAAAVLAIRGKPYKTATLVISGSITEVASPNGMIAITGDGLPTIILRGESKEHLGILNAQGLDKRVLYISDGNTLFLERHIVICGGRTDASGGAGIAIEGGTLIMKDAEISGNDAGSGMGGGVYVGKDSEFIMLGGLLTNNTTNLHGGAVFLDNGGTCTLIDGTISGNKAYVSGGGIFVGIDAEFVMNGGVIADNWAGGEHTVLLMGMPIPSGMGGGVYVCTSGRFTMRGGKIRENRAIAIREDPHNAGSGGGVYVDRGGVFTLEAGAIQQNGVTHWGGGVYTEGALTLLEQGAIQNNVARLGGGGVYIAGKHGGVFTMQGGIVMRNFTAGSGGAVHVTEQGVFTLEQGLIAKNFVTGLGHALAISGLVTINGGAVFDNQKPKNADTPQEDSPQSAEQAAPAVVIEPTGTLILRGGVVEGKIAMKDPSQFEDLRED
ncbi:MAG: right-handed parallel beta-helix repeat-containing protein [Treponema sp.]|jgi:hypothetical protein|nr:right-handed parallel beta-helix repeat-containing protein [Treponema sp.]